VRLCHSRNWCRCAPLKRAHLTTFTRGGHPERKSKSEGHCGSYRAGRERRNSQIPSSTQALLPTSTHSNGFCIIRVCISSSSSSLAAASWLSLFSLA
jgi:hypothetical protein